MTQAKQEGRLSRWSRRKQQNAEETRNEDLALELEQQNLPQNELIEKELDEAPGEGGQGSETQEPELRDVDMEPVESLTEESDLSKFMSPGVSDELRNLALRKMFKAPIFNIRDGLDEYDEDYTSFEKLGDIVTADMRHQMEMEAEMKAEAEAKEIAESVTTPDEQDPDGELEQIPSDAAAEGDDLEASADELALESDEIPDRLAEKTQRENE